MKRREFIKTSLTAAALAVPVAQLAAKEGPDGDKSSEGTGPQIARRRYRDTAMTVPLLGYGMMRMPRLSPERPDIDYATAERQIARAMEVGLNYFDTAYFQRKGGRRPAEQVSPRPLLSRRQDAGAHSEARGGS